MALVASICWGLFAPSLVQAQTDAELTASIVGKWTAQDRTGSTVYNFNEDGTWTEDGVYFLSDGTQAVSLAGEWYVNKGFFYHSVLTSNLPGKIKPGKFDKIKINTVTGREFDLGLSPGQFHPHLLKK